MKQARLDFSKLKSDANDVKFTRVVFSTGKSVGQNSPLLKGFDNIEMIESSIFGQIEKKADKC